MLKPHEEYRAIYHQSRRVHRHTRRQVYQRMMILRSGTCTIQILKYQVLRTVFNSIFASNTKLISPGSVFSSWTERSTNTDSSWSSVADPSSAKASIIQPLSRTSFVTQSTEVTVSSRDSVNAAEQLATVVHISAAGTIPIQINDSPSTM